MAQTYISSIVVQHFAISIPLIFLYARKRKLSNYISALLVIAGYSTHGYLCWSYEVTPSIFVSNGPSGPKTVNYMHIAHMHPSAYTASFFIGFLLADYVRNVFKPVGGRANNRWILYVALITNNLATSSTAIYNTWHLFPMSMAPIFIILLRMTFHFSTLMAILYIFSDGQNVESLRTPTKFDAESSMFLYRLNRFFAQLSIGYYLGNYFVIRTDFFTSKQLWTNSGLEMCKRTVSGFAAMSVMAAFLHLFFIAPFDAMRKHFLHSNRKKVE